MHPVWSTWPQRSGRELPDWGPLVECLGANRNVTRDTPKIPSEMAFPDCKTTQDCFFNAGCF
jgi:hypothetical protein